MLFAKVGGNEDLARTCIRALGIVMAAEFVLLLLLASIGFAYERRARQRDAASFHPPGQLVDVGGYRLHLSCAGSGGPTIVLEHGHRATYLDWYFVQPQIAKFARVCSYDRAGYGRSDPSPKQRIPSAMAEELHSLLHASGERPPYVLVGHSYGAMNAVMFAHKFPDDVAGLVLVDGSTPDSLPGASWRTRLWIRVMRFTIPFGLPRWRGWCRSGPQEVSANRAALTCRSQNFVTILREDAGFEEARHEIRAISSLGNVPLVVIARDPAVGRNLEAESMHTEQQRELAKLSSNSRFNVAEGSGHDVPLARPDVIVEAVKSLINLRAPAGSREIP
jgi:pimeloyl-ACP methyl ester carboxylesterase